MASISTKGLIGLAVTGGLVVGGVYLWKKMGKDNPVTNAIDVISKIPEVVVGATKEAVKTVSSIDPVAKSKIDDWNNLTDGDITTKDVTDVILDTIPIVNAIDAVGGSDLTDAASSAAANLWDSKTEHGANAIEAANNGDWGEAATEALKVTAAEPVVIAVENTVSGAEKLGDDWSKGDAGAVASDLWNATPAGQVFNKIRGLFG